MMFNTKAFKGAALAGLTAVAAVSTGAQAATEFTVGGKGRLRYEDTQRYGAAATSFTRNAFWSVRVRPSIMMKVDDLATVVAEPQFAKRLGRDNTYTSTSSSGSTTYNEYFHMHQGYVQLKFSDALSLKGGRMAMSYGDQMIIGPADWGVYGRSFDGAMLTFKSDLVKVDLGNMKIVSTEDKVGADRDLAVLYTSWNITEALKALDVYGLYESNQVNVNEARHAVGARAKAAFSGVDLGAEYTYQKGTRGFIANDDATSMLFAEAGFTFAELSKFRVGLEFNQANEYWMEWYPTTKSLLGRNDVVGRRNLTAYALRLSAEPDANLKVNLDYWMFSRTSDTATPYNTNGTTAVGATASSTSKDIGSSIELSMMHKASEKVEYGIGFAYFMQGAYLKDNFGDRTLTDFYALTNISF